MGRRKRRESTVFFAWERRRSRISHFLRRHIRTFAIVAGIVAIAVFLLQMGARSRKVFATRAAIDNILQAVRTYKVDHAGQCPKNLQELVAPADGHGSYLARVPSDGWGRQFRFVCPGRKHPDLADVTSAGPGGSFEQTDQIE